MSLPIPLSVSLQTDRRFMRITNQVRDLSFRSAVPGGFASAKISLNRPLSVQPDEIGYYAPLYIHDARTGRVVWEGRQEDPGRSAGSDGEVWDIAAIGPAGHVHDNNGPVVYIDQALDRWEESNASDEDAEVTVREYTSGGAWRLLVPVGTPVDEGWQANVVYNGCYEAGQDLARVYCNVINPEAAAWDNRLTTRPAPGGAQTDVVSLGWSSSIQEIAAARGGTPAIASGARVAHLRIVRTDPTAISTTSQAWGRFIEILIMGLRKDRNGDDVTSGYGNLVWTYQVVSDVLGRWCPQYDRANATIHDDGYGITQMCYPDGVTPAKVLEDLMELRPALYWAAWESNEAGKYRFEWIPWPTQVRYEASAVDGYSSTGSGDGLFNKAVVRRLNSLGRPAFTTRTQTVTELDAAGLTRTKFIDLSNETGVSATQAETAGDEFLLEHKRPPNAGKLIIARPILDRTYGLMVQPWEIRPGQLIRVSDIAPRTDSLNPAGRDGVTVFKIASVEYSARDASAQLELDSYSPSTARALARLRTRRIRRR